MQLCPAGAGLSDALQLQGDRECGTRFFDPEPSELAAIVVSLRPRRHRPRRCPSHHRESAPARKDHVPHPRSIMTSEASALGAAGHAVNVPAAKRRICWQKARNRLQATRRSGDVSEAPAGRGYGTRAFRTGPPHGDSRDTARAYVDTARSDHRSSQVHAVRGEKSRPTLSVPLQLECIRQSRSRRTTMHSPRRGARGGGARRGRRSGGRSSP